MGGKLIVVPTPIGNLEDITLRAINVLKEVDVVLSEDTRKTSFLLNHLQIKSKLESFHKFNEHRYVTRIVERLQSGENIALVSDAGTPGISDPGYLLVKHCVENEVDVECLPGATALIPAIVLSGLPNDRFLFEGFLPQKKGRQKKFKELVEETRTMVFYESPFRLMKMLEQIREFFGEDRRVSVSRELTKIYEETIRGTVVEVIEYYKSHTIKGEIVVVVEGQNEKEKRSKLE
jgi:16S rRNA (cytidine1402-2'-O)-methyltransferase